MQVEKIRNEPMGKPNASVYVQNLNERVKIADLKNSLFHLFSQHGEVHEVHAKRNIKQRGQAYVVAPDEQISEQMIKELRGTMFYGKPLRLSFAKKDSDFIAKLKGSFDSSVLKKRKAAQAEGAKIRELKMKRKLIDKVVRLRLQHQKNQQSNADGAGTTRSSNFDNRISGSMGQPEIYKILFIEKMPKNVKQEQLEDIFGEYNGFVEVRLIAEKGYAFVEYISDDYASYALQDVKAANLLQFEDPNTGLKADVRINYSKRARD